MTTYKLTGATMPIIDVNKVENLWCVYEHHNPPEIIYVNACRLRDVFSMREARDNSEWFRMYQKGGGLLLHITMITVDRNEAIRSAIERVKSLPTMPRCNLHGFNMRTASRPIICSNGVTYQTQSEAAKALGVAQPHISRNLRGALKSVNGYTFAYAPLPGTVDAATSGETAS